MAQTEQAVTAICRGKVNLTLDVLGRRPDGYHNLESVMQSVDLADVLAVRLTPGSAINITATSPGIPKGPSNTVYKACALFKDAAEVESGISVSIEKRIPTEAGLGGGSSDAAGTLIALNALYEYPLSDSELMTLAARIGSDVPYFLVGGTALISGRGENVVKLPDAPPLFLVIAKPDMGVSTSWAYGRLAAIADRRPGTGTKPMIEAVELGDRARVIEAISNDFDVAIAQAHNPISDLRDTMRELGAEAVMLCGSGAGVFGVFGSSEDAENACRSLSESLPFASAPVTTVCAVSMGEDIGD